MKQFFGVLTAVGLSFWLLLAKAPWPAHAQSQFKDDFSHDFSQWEVARGSMNLWSVTGEQAKATVTSQSTLTEIVPKDAYWNPNWRSLTYSFEYTPVTGADRNISFGYQDTLNWYDLHFVDTFYQLARVQNGVLTFSIFKNFALANGHSYHMRLVLRDGHIQFYVDGVQLFDEVDWSFNQNFGKISLKATAGSVAPTVVQFDNIVVTPNNIGSDVHLDVPLLKQTDSRWSDLVYDGAEDWSADKPSIQRWGCALTSMAMILQYYGLRQLPDGSALDPGSLNNWLRSQQDGYLDGGSLNWNAVSRLTKLIATAWHTVELETSRVTTSLVAARAEITANRPVVIGIPGHFLVGDGITGDNQEVEIRDPAYIFSVFSRHNADPTSVRTFIPSHTDLSALVIVAPVGIDVSLTDVNGRSLPNVIRDVTSARAVVDGSAETGVDSATESGPAMQVMTIDKPAAQDYRLTIATTTRFRPKNHLPERVQILAYDVAANLSDVSQLFTEWPSSHTFIIHYHTDARSTIAPLVMTWEQLRTDLGTALAGGGLTNHAVFHELDGVITLAEAVGVAQDPVNQTRYRNLFSAELVAAKTTFVPDAYQNLSADVQLLTW